MLVEWVPGIQPILQKYQRWISKLNLCWYNPNLLANKCGTVILNGYAFKWWFTLRWRQNGRNSVSNHQPGHCLLSLLFGRRSRKTSKLRVTGLCVGNSPGPVNSPHKGPVTRKMFPFDDVIMITWFKFKLHETYLIWTAYPQGGSFYSNGLF